MTILDSLAGRKVDQLIVGGNDCEYLPAGVGFCRSASRWSKPIWWKKQNASVAKMAARGASVPVPVDLMVVAKEFSATAKATVKAVKDVDHR